MHLVQKLKSEFTHFFEIIHRSICQSCIQYSLLNSIRNFATYIVQFFRTLDVYTNSKENRFNITDHHLTSWIHLALTYNASENTVTPYINAESDKMTKKTLQQTFSNYPGHWQIGRNDIYTYGLTKVDEMIFWDRPLTSDQIKSLYESYDSKFIEFFGWKGLNERSSDHQMARKEICLVNQCSCLSHTPQKEYPVLTDLEIVLHPAGTSVISAKKRSISVLSA